MADPGTMDQVARIFDAQAEEIELLGRRVAGRVDASSWTCARATRCRASAFEVQLDASAAAGELRDIAASLRALAEQRRLEELQAQMDALQAQIDLLGPSGTV